MSDGMIYTVGSDGSLARMRPGAPASEDHIQELIARHPDLIGDGDGELLLIQREHPVSDGTDQSGRWSIDHLFVTRDAVPVLVEVKRATDPRLRREVVGQMLDYAANSVAYWPAGCIASAFATTEGANTDADATLATFLGGGDPDTFWAQVDANVAAGRVKLVFVADVIPRELARIVEFLNEQMRADVRAVELKWFASDSGSTTLVPRIVGKTERAASQKAKAPPPEPVSAEQWIEKHVRPLGDNAVRGARVFLEVVHALDGEIVIPGKQGSLQAGFRTRAARIVYPLALWAPKAEVSISFQYALKCPGLVDPAARRRIYDLFKEAVENLSTPNLEGFPAFTVSGLAQVGRRDAVLKAGRALVNADVE